MKNIPFKVRMLIAFFAIFLLPLLVIGIPGGMFIINSTGENTTSEIERLCENAFELFETRIARMDGYMQQISNDSLMKGIMNLRDETTLFQRYSALDYSRYANQLRLMLVTTDAFDDLALCFPQQDFVLTQRGTYTLAHLFQHEFAVDGMDAADWLAILDSQGQTNRFLPVSGMTTFGVRKPGLLYVCAQAMKYEKATQFAVIYYLSATSLAKTFAQSMRYPGTVLSLEWEDGTTLYCLTEGEVATGTLFRWSRSLENTGLSMEITVPQNEISRASNEIKNAVLLILASMGALGGVLSAFVAHINYRPLGGIFSMLFERGTLPKEHPSASNLKAVERTLATLLDKDQYLQQQLNEYRDLLQYAALARLLDGSLSIDPATQAHTFDALGMPLPYRFLSVGVFYREQMGAVALLEQRIQSEQVLAYPIEQDGRLALLFNHTGEDAMRQLIAQPGMPLAIGISAPCLLLSDVQRAYREALYAVNYRPVLAESGAVFYADVYDARSNYFYPTEAETRIINLLRAGDAAGAQEAFEKLLRHNLDDEPAAYVLHRLFDSVAMSVFRQAGVDQATWERENPLPSADVPLDTLTSWMNALLSAAAAAGAVRGATAPDAFLQSVLAYIDETLCDPQLNLSGVAAHFGVSTSHLSRYIKREAGIGYLDLVNRKRVLLAKTLLRKGDMSVKHIAASVGFDSDVTLRRLFKKYEGVVPTQYAWSGDNDSRMG